MIGIRFFWNTADIFIDRTLRRIPSRYDIDAGTHAPISHCNTCRAIVDTCGKQIVPVHEAEYRNILQHALGSNSEPNVRFKTGTKPAGTQRCKPQMSFALTYKGVTSS